MKKKDLAWILDLPQDQLTAVRLKYDAERQAVLLSTDSENTFFEKEFPSIVETNQTLCFSLPSFAALITKINGRSKFELIPSGIVILDKDGKIKERLDYPQSINGLHFHSYCFQNVEAVPVSINDWMIHEKFRISLMEYPECDQIHVWISDGIMKILSMNGTAFCKTEFYSAGFEGVKDQTFTIRNEELQLLSGFFSSDQLLQFNLQQDDSTKLIIVNESLNENSKCILHLEPARPQRAFAKEILYLIERPIDRREIIDVSKFPMSEYRKANTENRNCSPRSSSKSTEFSVEMKDDNLFFNLSDKEMNLNLPQCNRFHAFINSYDMAQILAFQPQVIAENVHCVHWIRNETMISILK